MLRALAGLTWLWLAGQATAGVLPELAGVEVPGFALVAAARGGAVKTVVAGAADITVSGEIVRPLKADTPVRVASVSKLAVVLALHRLADAGRISLDEDASRYLGWKLRNPAWPDVAITVRQLMRHESSLSDAGGYSFPLGVRLRESLTAASFASARPGTMFDYANLNFPVLAELIEAVTGERFDRAMQTLVFQPLQLEACFNWSGCTAEFAASGAVLYRKSADGGESWAPDGPWVAQVDAERPGPCPVKRSEGAPCLLPAAGSGPSGNGSLFSPQGGLRISVLALAQLGVRLLADDGFLKPETRAALFRPLAIKPPGNGEETDTKLMQAWSEGGLHCFSGRGEPGGDQPLSPLPTPGCGHLGQAYGLLSGLIIDPAAGTVVAYALTGSAQAPQPGVRSRFTAVEEALLAKVGDWLSAKHVNR
jgi:CubicO group peptidase (beta-lactamase class C family)